MKITGAQAIVKSLENEKVDIIFGYPGAAICPFYDALVDSDIKHILTRTEQGAAHAANSYARVTGKVGVCVATSGPGATNLITGIATAYMDSIPIIAITGQVSSEQVGRDVFQEADITGATASFCKHSYLVKDAEKLPKIIKEAFYIASTGRPGPVVIDIPIDMQTKEIEFEIPESVEIRGYKPHYKGHFLQLKRVVEAISESKRPVICAGGGIIRGGAAKELVQFAEKCNIPITTTLMGIGSVPYNHPLNLGMIGSHGVYTANRAIHKSDLLIIMGARVGDRAVGSPNKIENNAKVIHIDIDPAEIGKNIKVEIPVTGHIKDVLQQLSETAKKADSDEWVDKIKKMKEERKLKTEANDENNFVNPKYALYILTKHIDENSIVTTEVGQNQIWAANWIGIKKPGTFITSGGMGTMGYGLPAAVGAKVGLPLEKVICISGDGSFQMSMNELGSIKQNDIGVKVILFNNSRLGLVREMQKQRFCGRYSGVFLGESPDFLKLFDAYGFKGKRINKNSQIEMAIKEMLSDDKPYLLECIIDPEESTM